MRLVAIVQGNLKIEPGVEVAADPDKSGVDPGLQILSQQRLPRRRRFAGGGNCRNFAGYGAKAG